MTDNRNIELHRFYGNLIRLARHACNNATIIISSLNYNSRSRSFIEIEAMVSIMKYVNRCGRKLTNQHPLLTLIVVLFVVIIGFKVIPEVVRDRRAVTIPWAVISAPSLEVECSRAKVTYRGQRDRDVVQYSCPELSGGNDILDDHLYSTLMQAIADRKVDYKLI